MDILLCASWHTRTPYWMQDFYLKVDSICMLKTLLEELHAMGVSEVILNQQLIPHFLKRIHKNKRVTFPLR